MRVIHIMYLISAIAILSFSALTNVAWAQPADHPRISKSRTAVKISAWKHEREAGRTGKPPMTQGHAKQRTKDVSEERYLKQLKAYQAQLRRAIAYNEGAALLKAKCVDSTTASLCRPAAFVALPTPPNIPAASSNLRGIPFISPQQAAYYAVARLRLPPPKAMIGPPPSINEWKMAAVGYPMWLWADGNLDPAPSSDSVGGLSVSLNARLVKVVYNMGDGHKVTCNDVSHKWTRAVTPGTRSPVCGYVYQRPSLPKGKYTITATTVWAVDWAVNGVGGTIPFYGTSSTQIPVGELQVLTR
jgi:hypothetical protein